MFDIVHYLLPGTLMGHRTVLDFKKGFVILNMQFSNIHGFDFLNIQDLHTWFVNKPFNSPGFETLNALIVEYDKHEHARIRSHDYSKVVIIQMLIW